MLDFIPITRENIATIRARLDSDTNAGIDPSDSRFLDTVEGGIYWDLTQASALEIERLYDFINEMVAAIFPAFAWGTFLDEHGVTINVPRKAAVKATGEVLLTGTVGALIATGTRLATEQVDPNADPIEFVALDSTVIVAAPGPTNLAGVVALAPGVLDAGIYYYRVTAEVPAGETVASDEIAATVPVQTLGAPTGLAGAEFASGGTLATNTYFYKVTALNENGETIGSAEISKAVTGPNGRVDLTWNAVAGASSYRIYRGTATGAQNLYYTSATNSYSDTNAASTAGTVPVVNTAQAGRVTLTWNAVAGATGYLVYRGVQPLQETLLVDLGVVLTYVDEGTAIQTSARPPTNRIFIEAAIAGGEGNVAPGTITQLLSPVEGVASVVNSQATTGGSDVEADEIYCERILLEYAAPHGAGNAADYERWARAYLPIGFATVEPLWNGAGTVRVIVTDNDNNPVSNTVVAGLQADLDPVAAKGMGRAPIGAIVTVVTPSVVTVNVSATVTMETGYSLDGASGTIALRDLIQAALSDYIDGLDPGDDVILNEVIGQIMSVDGVYDVSAVQLNGSASNVAIIFTQIAKVGTVTFA